MVIDGSDVIVARGQNAARRERRQVFRCRRVQSTLRDVHEVRVNEGNEIIGHAIGGQSQAHRQRNRARPDVQIARKCAIAHREQEPAISRIQCSPFGS